MWENATSRERLAHHMEEVHDVKDAWEKSKRELQLLHGTTREKCTWTS